jgi:hypothetical protein
MHVYVVAMRSVGDASVAVEWLWMRHAAGLCCQAGSTSWTVPLVHDICGVLSSFALLHLFVTAYHPLHGGSVLLRPILECLGMS